MTQQGQAMFDHTSRYYHLDDRIYEAPDGHQIAYKARRFLPQARDLPLLGEATGRVDERLDLIAARSLGDPLLFWQICDANNAMDPFDLVDEAGRVLRVPIPQFRK
jgi:hypothetical protein